jgi:N-acetylmuramoyl-L-alanine amidase
MPAFVAAIALFFSLAVAGQAAIPAATVDQDSPLASLKGKTILVDPGHNGGNASHPEIINKLVPAGGFRKECDTEGAATSDEQYTEPEFTWDVAKRLTKLLKSAGAKVVLTRKNNSGVGPCINKRAAIGNKAKAAAAALDEAGLSRSNYRATNGIEARKDLGGLNLSKVPKVFTELGNMRNAGDARRLKSAKWREHVARALRSGLAEYLAKAQ